MSIEKPTSAELLGDDEPVEAIAAATSIAADPALAEAASEPVVEAPHMRRRKASALKVPTLEEAVAEIQAVDETELPEHSLHPLLTNAEVLEARAEARTKLKAEQIKTAKKKIVDDEIQRLRTEGGMTTGDGFKDQMVMIALDLAPHSPFIVLNHRPYYHAQTYKVPRHVAETLREIQQRGWRHQDEIDGKTLTEHYQRARQTGLSPVKGITNAPQPMAA